MSQKLTKEEMLYDIAEYQLNFMDLPTVISLARKAIMDEYKSTTKDYVQKQYDQIFNKDLGEVK